MKSIDKFALIPIERYERLLKTQNLVDNHKKDETNSKLELKEDSTNNNESDKELEKSVEVNNSPEKVPEENINPDPVTDKIPHPPPGIPNKPQTNHFKWIRLFSSKKTYK